MKRVKKQKLYPLALAAKRPHALQSFRKAKPRTVINIIPLSSASIQSSILTAAGARVYAAFLVLPNLHFWLQKNVQRDRLTITRDFSWKPGFQYRIRNQEMTTSPSQRSTSLWLARKSHATFSRNFASFSSARAWRAVIWITRTNIIFQLMKA